MEHFVRSGLTFPVLDTAPTGPRASLATMVLLHGFPQGPAAWDAVVPRLTGAGYRVVVPTLRGYAASARPRGVASYSADELGADLEALVGALGGPVHLVGHDWGASIAWLFAARRPELLRSVTGVSVPPLKALLQGLRNPRQLRASAYIAALAVPGLVERAAGRKLGRRGLRAALAASGQTPERVDRDLAPLLASPAALTAAVSYYRAARIAPREHPGDITVPALFVWSTGDTAITSAATRSAARCVAGSYRGATLPGVSHWIPEEAPAQLSGLILEHAGAHAG